MIIDISRLRKAKGMSQRELAELIQVRQSFLSAIENGRSRLPDEKLGKLREIFGSELLDKYTIADAADADSVVIKPGLSESDIVGQLLRHFHDLAHKADSHSNSDNARIESLVQRNDFLNERNDRLSEKIDELLSVIDNLRQENFHLKEILLTNGINIEPPL